jgi:hypothetical protein
LKCEEIKVLLSALVDNELTPEQKRMVTDHLVSCVDCREEYSRLVKLKEATDKMTYLDLPDRLWTGYWQGIYNRIERGLGWIFISLGAIFLLTFFVWELLNEFFLDSHVPIILKIGLGAFLLGIIVLMISILRERLFSRAHDRYEEIDI